MVYARPSLLIMGALALVLTLGAVGLGAWYQYVVHDFKIHGAAALDTVSLESPGNAKYWRDYFIAASLNTFKENQLADVASSDLAQYVILIPQSKGLVTLTCIGWFLTVVACIIAIVDACHRARVKEKYSFRPTASALGMNPNYPDITPQTTRSRVPTMYDPRRPLHAESKETLADSDEESAKRIRGEEQAYRDSALTEEERSSLELEKEFMHLLGVDRLEKAFSVDRPEKAFSVDRPETAFRVDRPEKALQLRPKRPWSESPMGRKRDDDDDVHSI